MRTLRHWYAPCCSVRTMSAIVGRTLGEFVVADKLGEGGFGEVYRAHQPSLEREAVIKLLRADSSETTAQRFLREARLAAQLDHPYAAHVYAFGREPDGLLWIAMELVRGTPLSRLLALQGAIPLDRFVPFFERLCEVVQAAHERGIIHRDIKPANIMVVAHGARLVPKLIDLGIATYAKSAAEPVPTRLATSQRDAGLADTLETPNATGSQHADPQHLTHTGQLVGTPLYMAPERWLDTALADARGDIYALGLVAYECLTGYTPFRSSHRADVMRQHCDVPAPALPAELPAGLSREIERALAKDPSERHAGAVALAAAVRAASGLATGVPTLPRLRADVLERVLAKSPRPIADAIALLASATSLRELRSALVLATRAIVRYVGVLAIAGRATLARDAASLDLARPLLEQIARRPLTDDEWCTLAAAVCQPLLAAREAFPIPALIDFVTGVGPGRNAIAMLTASATGEHDDTAEMRALVQALHDLAVVLDALQFLDDYALIAGEVALVGVARGEPIRDDCAVRLLGPDRDTLIDFGPLIRIAAPMPAAGGEPFVFDGLGRRGAVMRTARGFERRDESVWPWLAWMWSVEPISSERDAADDLPYPGLVAFGVADAQRFFGRDDELAAFRNRLRVSPLLAIVGASGAGKSSFALAGVAADLATEWHVAVVRPGADPVATLAGVVGRLINVPADELEDEIVEDRAALGRRLRAYASFEQRGRVPGRDGRGVLVVVDQLEELFTACRDDVRRGVFALALAGALRAATDPVRVVVTLRDDFIARSQELPGLRERIGDGLFLLATPSSEQLARIIVEPARRAGYDFDEPELPARMVAAVAGRPAALPLLAFAAAQLWRLRDTTFKLLRASAYDAIGGVTGALARHAETTFVALAADAQRRVRVLMRGLVTAAGTRAVLARAEAIRLAGADITAEQVIESLLASRLVSVRDTDAGEHLELAHEALIVEWPRLAGWREDDRIGARLRDQVRAAACSWVDRGRPEGALWAGDALRDVDRWYTAHADALSNIEHEFVRRSRSAAARARTRKRFAMLLAFALLAAALAIITWLNARTARERDRAEQSAARERAEQARAMFENGRRAHLAGADRVAAKDLADAFELGHDTLAARFILGRVLARLRNRVAVLHAHTGQISTLDVHPDDQTFATGGADRTVRIWARSSLVATLPTPAHVWRVRFSPDGSRLVACGYDGFATVWELATRRPVVVHPGDGLVVACTFVAGGARLVTATSAGQVRLWNAVAGELVTEFPHHDNPWNEIFVGETSDGSIITTSDTERRIRLWGPDGKTLGEIATEDMVGTAALAGDTLITAGRMRNTVEFWSLRERRALGNALSAHTARIVALRVSPDHKYLLSASADGDARVWGVEQRTPITRLAGSANAYDARFDRSGDAVVIASNDGARVFRARTGQMVARFDGHEQAVWTAAFVGGRVATASWDGTVQLWRPTGDLLLERGPVDAVDAVPQIGVDSRRGRFAVGQRGTAAVVDARTSEVIRVLAIPSGEMPISIAFARQGEVATITETGKLTVFASNGQRILAQRELVHRSRVVRRLVVSPDGRRVAVATDGGPTDIYALPGLEHLQRLADRTGAYTSRVSMLAWDATGTLAVIRDTGSIDVWTPELRLLHTIPTKATVLAFHGDRLAAATADGTVTLWSVSSPTSLSTLRGHSAEVFGLTGLGSDLVSASADGTLRRWPSDGAGPARIVRGHEAQVVALDASPDGRLIASGSLDDTLRIWDADGLELARDRAHAGGVLDVRWVAEDRIATSGVDGVIRVWRMAIDRRRIPAMIGEARCLLAARVDCGNSQTSN